MNGNQASLLETEIPTQDNAGDMRAPPIQSIPFSGRRWLDAVWQRKTSVLGGVLAIVSLSLAHYAGFLMNVPLQVVAVVGVPLVKGVTTTFWFYVFFCAVFARVFASIVQFITLPLLALIDRLSPGFAKKKDWSRQRRFVRTHNWTIKWEGHIWLAFQASIFLFLMLWAYVKFSITWFSGLGLCISVLFVFLSGLVRAGFFLQPKRATFIKKMKTRPARSGRAASAAFVTVTAALIVVAFFIGSMRASLLRDHTPQRVVTKEFTGDASIIASSEGALLLFQKQGDALRYIFSSPDFTASMESQPVFLPIGANNKLQ